MQHLLGDDATERRRAAESREVKRLGGLSDRWLANELLRLARRVRADLPADGGDGYVGMLLWDVVPEVARRLGAPLLPTESIDHELRVARGDGLRAAVAACLRNVGPHLLRAAMRPDEPFCPVALLTRPPGEGNPVTMGLDRVAGLAPPTDGLPPWHRMRIPAAHAVMPGTRPGADPANAPRPFPAGLPH